MAIKQIDTETGKVSILTQSRDIGIPQELQPGVIKFREGKLTKSIQLSKTIVPNKFPFVYQQDDQIFMEVDNVTRQITKVEGKYFLPQLSPNGLKILFQELTKGYYVTDIQSSITNYIGNGDDAVWSQDSKYIIYEVTADAGHLITSSELYITNLDGHK